MGMKRVITEYVLKRQPVQDVQVSTGVSMLSVGLRNGEPCLFVFDEIWDSGSTFHSHYVVYMLTAGDSEVPDTRNRDLKYLGFADPYHVFWRYP